MLLFYAKNESAESPKTQRLQCRSKKKAVPLGNNKHKQNLQIKNSLSLGGEMSQRNREGRLALKPRLPPNQRTHPSDCKAGARKKPSPLGKVAPTGDGRGELTLKPRLPPNKDTEPSLPSMELRGLGGELRQVTTTTRFQHSHSPPPLPKPTKPC